MKSFAMLASWGNYFCGEFSFGWAGGHRSRRCERNATKTGMPLARCHIE
jgi:hypothetical protein